jgi:transposase
LTKIIKGYGSGIINYVKLKITAGVIEGINNKIQLAKKKKGKRF